MSSRTAPRIGAESAAAAETRSLPSPSSADTWVRSVMSPRRTDRAPEPARASTEVSSRWEIIHRCRRGRLRGSCRCGAIRSLPERVIRMAPPTLHSPLPLDRVPGLERCSLDLLRRLGQRREAPAGQVILSEGRRPLAIYVVEAGAVALAATGRAGNRIVLGILGPGDVFGEQALIQWADRDRAEEAPTLLPEARALLVSRFLM